MGLETVFIANGNARLGAQGAEQARTALQNAGFDIVHFHVARKRREFNEQLARHVRDRAPLIAVGGGDGTQRSAAGKIADTTSTMMVVPLGTGNAWASDLGIPSAFEAMAGAFAEGEQKMIDLGTANGAAFVNVATIGLTSLIVKNMPDMAKGRIGRMAYVPAVLRSLSQLRPFHLRVETDDQCFTGDALLFVAAAGRTHAGPFPVTKHAENDDGLLSLYALHGKDWRGLVRFGSALMRGDHTALEEVWCCEAKRASVTTKPRKSVITDGERGPRTPLQLGIHASALRVLVPRQSAS